MIALSIIGLLAAIWTWDNVHPIAGVAVGFLGVGGLGWKFIFTGTGGLALKFHPHRRRLPEFRAAWDAMFGESPSMDSRTDPPRGAFNKWITDRNRTGVPAGAWLRGERLPTAAELDTLAADAARLAPSGLPDGRPFPGAEHAHRLVTILQLAEAALDAAEKWELTLFTGRLLRCVDNPDKVDATTESVVEWLNRDAAAANAILLRHDMLAEARELTAIAWALAEYWRLRSQGGESLPDAS